MEIWKPIPHSNYDASSLGRIRSPRGNVLTPCDHPLGYHIVTVRMGDRSICKTVHSLVALAFHGPRPEGLDIAHFDHDKHNNRPDNLRYTTHAENMQDSVKAGVRFNPRSYPFRSLEVGETFEANAVKRASIASAVRQARIRTGQAYAFAANDNGSWTVRRVA